MSAYDGITRENLLSAEEMKPIRTARVVIMIVAVLNILAGLFFLFVGSFVDQAVDALGKDGNGGVQAEAEGGDDEEAAAEEGNAAANLQKVKDAAGEIAFYAWVCLGTGAFFIGLFIWAKSNPFGATLAALSVWLLGQFGGLVSAPEDFHRGLFLKIIIFIILLKGVLAGLQYRKILQEVESRS